MSASRPIFVRTDKGDLVPIYEQPYESESVFQAMLAQYPDLLLPGDDRTPYSKLLLIKREKGVPIEQDSCDVYYLDHLFVDQSGVPTLVEVKRRSDTRNRRESVAQMLDYAANGIANWGIETLRKNFEDTCAEDRKDPGATLRTFLEEDGDAEGFWQKVEDNLANDKIRMIFVADQISVELRRITEFLNRQMATSEMIAIELRQFVGQNVQAFVPDVIVKPEPGKVKGRAAGGEAGSATEWTQERFLAKLEEEVGPEVVDVVIRILDWSSSNGAIVWYGKGTAVGSCAPGYSVTNGGPFYPLHYYTYGRGEVQFKNLQKLPPFDNPEKRRELKDRLNAIPGIVIPDDGISRRPAFPLSVLVPEGRLDHFFTILLWVIDEVRTEKVRLESGCESS